MMIKEVYEKIGGDYEGILGRLRSDDMIQRFLLKFLNEKSYEELLVAAEANNVEEAILSAHKLKGVTANLSFTKLFESLNALLTDLRRENQDKVDGALLQVVKDNYHQVVQSIQEL